MKQTAKSTGDKPRRKGKVGGKKQNLSGSKNWEFKPRLKNEAIVLHSILSIYEISFYEEIVNNIRDLITSLIRNHGFTDGPKRYNVIKQYTIDLIELRNPENPGWLSTSEVHRVPSKLGINMVKLVVDYLTCNDTAMRHKYYQVIITILNISRIIDGLVDADFKSVTDKASPINESLLSDFSTYVKKKLEPYKYDIHEVNLSSYKINFKKNGPNGQPKLESSEMEAVSLLKDKQLAQPFKIFCTEMGIDHLPLYVEGLANQAMATHKESSEPNKENRACLRKLVTIPDSGMKTRIVAIVDFWTQLALEPFRDHVQTVIRKLYKNTDFRMSQDSGVAAMVDFQRRCIEEERVHDQSLNIKGLKFYDISSWTDRFHRDLQKIVVKELYGSKLAQAWAQLTVHCSWNVGNTGRTIKYGQGQGMGTNGSFDVATLTDHLLINMIYDEYYENKHFRVLDSYGKVGDDLWIYDPEDRYPKICEQINLPINLSKSKEFRDGLGSVAEFCSRTFIDGCDVSRISPNIISKSKDFRYIPLLLAFCSSRGVQLERSSFSMLENIPKQGIESYYDKLQPWIISVYTVSSTISDSLTLDYLEAGNWITENTKRILEDQATLFRIQLARCITSLVESYSDIIAKISETIEGEGDLSMEDIFQLSLGRFDMFDLKSADSALALKWFKSGNSVLTPKQIFVLKRYITQNDLVSNEFMKLYELDPQSDSYLTDAKDLLEKISERSVYDRGNLCYDTAAYQSMQYAVTKTIQRLDQEFKTFALSSSELQILNQIVGLEFKDLELVREHLQITVNDSVV